MAGAIIRIPTRAAAFNAALEGLTRLNVALMGATNYPPLYSAGVRYKTEPREVWRHVADVLAEGWGDCEDLSAWRAAELRITGEDPGASVATYKSGARRYHAIVERSDGTIEDPSRELGMGRKKRAMDFIQRQPGLCGSVLGEDDDGDEPAEDVVTDPTPEVPDVTTDVQESASKGGWRAVARVPMAKGRALVTASSRSGSKEEATRKALNLASKALDSPYAKTLIPPQAQMALKVLRSKAGRRVGRFAKKFL